MDNLSLIKLARSGSGDALNQLAEKNRPLVISIAKRFVNSGAEFDDLVQLGMMGLIKAVKNFNTELGTQFSTYAVPMIAGEIKRFLRDDGNIKVSRSVKELSFKILKFRDEYVKKHLKEPKITEIAQKLSVDADTVAFALGATQPVGSIYQSISDDDGLYLIDTLKNDETSESFDDIINLKTAINRLDNREKKIINLRYFSGLTQTEISKELGISQVQVSRIEKKSLLKLKELAGCQPINK